MKLERETYVVVVYIWIVIVYVPIYNTMYVAYDVLGYEIHLCACI